MIKLFTLVFALSLVACDNETSHSKIEKWVKVHPHPIHCVKNVNILRENVWTLTDAKGELYVSQPTAMELPDTLR